MKKDDLENSPVAEYVCNGLNVCVSPDSYVAVLNTTVMVLGGEVFEG